MNNASSVPKRCPVWFSLMYSTSYMLILCGIPGTPIAAFLLFLNGKLTKWEAVTFSAVMIAFEIVIASVLLTVASLITKLRSRRILHEPDA